MFSQFFKRKLYPNLLKITSLRSEIYIISENLRTQLGYIVLTTGSASRKKASSKVNGGEVIYKIKLTREDENKLVRSV